MSGDDNRRLIGIEPRQDPRPIVGVEIDVVGREPRKNRKDSFFSEVADEQRFDVGNANRLIAASMGEAEGRKFDDATAEIDRSAFPIVDLVRRGQFHTLENGCNIGPKCSEHAEIGCAFHRQFIALRGIVEDVCRTFERLSAETVLRMEMREREDELTPRGEPLSNLYLSAARRGDVRAPCCPILISFIGLTNPLPRSATARSEAGNTRHLSCDRRIAV